MKEGFIKKIINNINANKELAKKVKNDKENFPPIEENFKPIRVAIIDAKNIDLYTKKMLRLIEKKGERVNFYRFPPLFKKDTVKNAGDETYVIPGFNEKDKFSERYWGCTGVVFVGKDKETGKQISFMTHQDPYSILDDKEQIFKEDLSERIKEFKNKVLVDSIDAIVYGGYGYNNSDQKDDFELDEKDEKNEKEKMPEYTDYKKSIVLIGEVIKNELGFEPTVIVGPNSNYKEEDEDSYPTEAYFDTQNRRLFLVRPYQDNNKFNEDYLPSQVEEKSKEW